MKCSCLHLLAMTVAIVGVAVAVNRDSMAHPPAPEPLLPMSPETLLKDVDVASQAITDAVGPLLAIDLEHGDAVARQLQVRWVERQENTASVKSFFGVDCSIDAPIESIEYRRGTSSRVVSWSDVTLKIRPEHCYTGSALVYNCAPEKIAAPYSLPHDDPDDAGGRARFTTGQKSVELTYRPDPSSPACISEIYIRQTTPVR